MFLDKYVNFQKALLKMLFNSRLAMLSMNVN